MREERQGWWVQARDSQRSQKMMQKFEAWQPRGSWMYL